MSTRDLISASLLSLAFDDCMCMRLAKCCAIPENSPASPDSSLMCLHLGISDWGCSYRLTTISLDGTCSCVAACLSPLYEWASGVSAVSVLLFRRSCSSSCSRFYCCTLLFAYFHFVVSQSHQRCAGFRGYQIRIPLPWNSKFVPYVGEK